MRRGFLLQEDKKRRKRVMQHFAFKTWGPLYESLCAVRFKGIHRYMHTRSNAAFYCWESLVHHPDFHFHHVYTERDEDIQYLPSWIREPMMQDKDSKNAQWCLRCVLNHNGNAEKPRTSAEYWAFKTLYQRGDPDSVLSIIPPEIAEHIAQYLLGPYIPKLRFKRCASELQQQLREQFFRFLDLNAMMPVIHMHEDDEEFDSSDSDLMPELEDVSDGEEVLILLN